MNAVCARFHGSKNSSRRGLAKATRGFTLIELLIVVAIIAILAAIAVPNFLEAQIRAKVSRVSSDMRTLAIGLEAFRVDNDEYPEGTDNPTKYPQKMADQLGGLAKGYYTFRTRGAAGEAVGTSFAGLTTPIAFVASIQPDPFVSSLFPFTYSYRNAKDRRNGWIITSAGPDNDLIVDGGVGDTDSSNPFSTAADTSSPARLGDINEREVIHFFEGTSKHPGAGKSLMREYLTLLTYDATNGSKSSGDLWSIP